MKDIEILYIDDDDLLLDLFKYMLKSFDYNISTCSNCIDGLDMVLSNNYDLILTDYSIPGSNVPEFINKVHNVKPESSVYVITGFIESELEEIVKKSGAMGVLKKPFEIDSIVSIIEKNT